MKVALSQNHPLIISSCSKQHYSNMSYKNSKDITSPITPPPLKVSNTIGLGILRTKILDHDKVQQNNYGITSTTPSPNPIQNIVK